MKLYINFFLIICLISCSPKKELTFFNNSRVLIPYYVVEGALSATSHLENVGEFPKLPREAYLNSYFKGYSKAVFLQYIEKEFIYWVKHFQKLENLQRIKKKDKDIESIFRIGYIDYYKNTKNGKWSKSYLYDFGWEDINNVLIKIVKPEKPNIDSFPKVIFEGKILEIKLTKNAKEKLIRFRKTKNFKEEIWQIKSGLISPQNEINLFRQNKIGERMLIVKDFYIK